MGGELNKKKGLMYACLGLSVAAGLIAFRLRPENPGGGGENAVDQGTARAEKIVSDESGGPRTSDKNGPPPAGSAFARWIKEVASQMDGDERDVKFQQSKVAKLIRQLSKDHRRQLLQTALDPQSPVAEKVLSTYMLVEAGSAALPELHDLIVAPIEAETRGTPGGEAALREKNLRIMALDGLSSVASRNAEVWSMLARAADEVRDMQLRTYLQRKLRAKED